MMLHLLLPSSDRQTAAVMVRHHLSPVRGLAKAPRAASSRRAGRFVLAMAVAGLLPLSGLAQHHWRHGGSYSGAQLSAVTCSQSTLSGAASDACAVTLSAAASYRGTTVSLSSSSTAVAVPASVMVPRGATTASFTINSSAVTSSQSAILTASAGGTSQTFVLTLNAAAGSAGLTVNSTNVAFGSVTQNTTATQTVTLTSSGTAALTIQSATVTGTGFSATGLTLPVTLSPNQSATLELQFNPTTAGAATGAVTISSNASGASGGGAVTISLSGTGGSSAASSTVDLSWNAPASSSDPVAGYNIYRAAGSGSYQLLNTSVNQPATYADTTAQSGSTYNYKVTSVDASGVESTASNIYTVSIP